MARAGAWLLLAALPFAAAQAMDVPTFAAQDFVESVGVNTHLRHRRSVYDTQFALLKQRLIDAHITHIRDGAMDKDGQFHDADAAPRFAELGRAGIRVTFVFRPMVPREFVQGWPARVAPAFEAYELPNELNQVKNLPWADTLRVYMPLFREYVRGDPRTANYPIVGPSLADVHGNPFEMLGNRASELDFGNIHKYYRAWNPGVAGYGKPGEPPCERFRYGELAYELCQARRVSGDKPVICTEAGYATGGKPGFFVTPEIQARYVARMLLLHFKAGISRTFVYQLADHGKDTGGTLGLLDANGEMKPAFRELTALLGELVDEKGAGSKPLDARLEGETDGVQTLALSKRDGSYRLVMWLEKPGYDVKTSQPIAVPAQAVRVTLPRGLRARRVMTFDASGAPRLRAMRESGNVALEVSDNVSVVDIGGEAR